MVQEYIDEHRGFLMHMLDLFASLTTDDGDYWVDVGGFDLNFYREWENISVTVYSVTNGQTDTQDNYITLHPENLGLMLDERGGLTKLVSEGE